MLNMCLYRWGFPAGMAVQVASIMRVSGKKGRLPRYVNEGAEGLVKHVKDGRLVVAFDGRDCVFTKLDAQACLRHVSSQPAQRFHKRSECSDPAVPASLSTAEKEHLSEVVSTTEWENGKQTPEYGDKLRDVPAPVVLGDELELDLTKQAHK